MRRGIAGAMYAARASAVALAVLLAGCSNLTHTGGGALTDGGDPLGKAGSAGEAGRAGRAASAGEGGAGDAGRAGRTASAGQGGAGTAGSGGAPAPKPGPCPRDLALPAICRMCADGTCGVAECIDGRFSAWRCPNDPPPADCNCARGAYVPVCGADGQTHDASCGQACVPVAIACQGPCPCKKCVASGCSGQVCADAVAADPIIGTCEERPEYACYRKATCEPQAPNGNCGFTPTPELTQCLRDAREPSGLRWYTSCGHPVCRSDEDPFDDPNIANCTTETAGDACTEEGKRCDGVAACGATLICAASDPTMGPVGCPISRARFKEEIAYLNEQDRRDYHAQLMSLPLASYQYKQAPAAGPQLGFIIEDIEPSVAVSGDHVNMYGYLSMAVAAIQVQQEQIAALQRELETLRAQLPAEADAVCAP
jgi:hypothetical protein